MWGLALEVGFEGGERVLGATEMEEGVRLLSEMSDCTPEELEIGMPVEVEFTAVTDEVTLPRFRRA